MPNVRKLQESKRCGKCCNKQSNAIIDAVARKLNKEITSYYSKTGEQTKIDKNIEITNKQKLRAKVILTNIIWPVKTDKRSNVEDPKNLKLYSLKHKTRMNKKATTQIYTSELWNNRRSYAVKTNRIIMKTTYKRDAKKKCS